jgi:hypothetical protein
MQHRWSLVAVGLACLAGLAWFVLDTPPPPVAAIDGGRPDALEGPVLPPVTQLEDGPAGSTAPLPVVQRRTIEGVPAADVPAQHPWHGLLAGVTGRIVEADGQPIVGLSVDLLEVDMSVVLAAERTALGNPSLEVDEAVTGDDGRFVLDDATVGAFHVLGIDRGGARSALRIVEQALVYGERVDLGDIVLEGSGTLIGTVVDEDGEPVAGARVRVAPVPDIVVEVGVLDVRHDSLIAIAEGGELQALPIPHLIGSQLNRLPVPTTTTAADGSFRLEGVPLKRVVGGVDHPGHVAALIAGFDVKPGEHDLGELELVFGRTVTGRVVDSAGTPVVGAEVCAGVLQSLAPVGILQPAGSTDATGAFTLRGVPEVGNVVGFARRSASDAWVGVQAGAGEERLEFNLSGAGRVALHVVGPDGEPVSGARFEFFAQSSHMQFDQFAQVLLLGNTRAPSGGFEVDEVEPGVYHADTVSHGLWVVEAHANGFAPARQKFDHHGQESLVQVTCAPGQRLTVRVLDAVTGAAVARAHASIIAPTTALVGAVAAAWTGADGLAELGPFTPLSEALELGKQNSGPEDVVLRVQHPAYGEHCASIPPGLAVLDVRLAAPCTLTGRIHWGGATPDRRYMLFLTRDGVRDTAEMFATPRLNLSDAEGKFRFTGLAAGRYELHVAERYFEGDPLGLVIAQSEPVMRFRAELDVRPGEPTFVDVDLTPTGKGPTARIEGSVRVNGAPVADAEVVLNGSERVTLHTDSNGEFRSGELSALRGVWSTIEGDVELGDGTRLRRQLDQRWTEVKPGQVVRIDVDLQLAAIVVEVRDKVSGTPLEGANVAVQGLEVAASTDADGHATLSVDVKEGTSLQISAESYAQHTVRLDAKSEPMDDRLVIELEKSVPCKGRVIMNAGDVAATTQWSYIHVRHVTTGASSGTSLEARNDFSFAFDGLGPGRYQAHIYMNGDQGAPVEFELGPAGASDLALEYTPQQQREDD